MSTGHYSHFVNMINILFNNNSYVNSIQINIGIGLRSVQMLGISLYIQQKEIIDKVTLTGEIRDPV